MGRVGERGLLILRHMKPGEGNCSHSAVLEAILMMSTKFLIFWPLCLFKSIISFVCQQNPVAESKIDLIHVCLHGCLCIHGTAETLDGIVELPCTQTEMSSIWMSYIKHQSDVKYVPRHTIMLAWRKSRRPAMASLRYQSIGLSQREERLNGWEV